MLTTTAFSTWPICNLAGSIALAVLVCGVVAAEVDALPAVLTGGGVGGTCMRWKRHKYLGFY